MAKVPCFFLKELSNFLSPVDTPEIGGAHIVDGIGTKRSSEGNNLVPVEGNNLVPVEEPVGQDYIGEGDYMGGGDYSGGKKQKEG